MTSFAVSVCPMPRVANSTRPSAFTAQRIGDPPLRIRLSLATSLQRPATPAQQATGKLIRETIARAMHTS